MGISEVVVPLPNTLLEKPLLVLSVDSVHCVVVGRFQPGNDNPTVEFLAHFFKVIHELVGVKTERVVSATSIVG